MAEIVSVPAIVTIAYMIGLAAKLIPEIKDETIPVIVGVSGGVIGALALWIMPEFPANDIITAIAIGVASGLAATGVNQIWKQVLKK